MTNKSLNILIILFLFFCTIQFSCSNEKKTFTEIKFWAMGSEAEFVTKLIPEFEKHYPHIKVKVQAMPWTAAQEKLITAFASDNTPDICQLGNTWIPQFAALNAIIPLDNLIASSDELNRSRYFDGIWRTNIIDGKIYGIPWYVDTRVLYYRKDVLQRAGYSHPPRNWEELLDASKKIKTLFKGEEKYAIYLPTNEWAPFVQFGLQANAELISENLTKANFSSPEFKEAFDFLISFHKQKLAPIGISQVTNVYQAFADEYFSMYISGPWNIPEFKKWMKGDLANEWMTAPMPGYKHEYPGLSLAGGSSLVIFSRSEHKKEALALIEFLSEAKTQIEFYKLTNDLPSVREAWEDSVLKNDIYMNAFYEQFHNVAATPKIPEWEQIAFSKIQLYAELAARNEMSTKEALMNLDKDVDKILEKRKWMLEH